MYIYYIFNPLILYPSRHSAHMMFSITYTMLVFISMMQSESAQGEAAASAMGGRGRGGAFPGRGRGMRRR